MITLHTDRESQLRRSGSDNDIKIFKLAADGTFAADTSIGIPGAANRNALLKAVTDFAAASAAAPPHPVSRGVRTGASEGFAGSQLQSAEIFGWAGTSTLQLARWTIALRSSLRQYLARRLGGTIDEDVTHSSSNGHTGLRLSVFRGRAGWRRGV